MGEKDGYDEITVSTAEAVRNIAVFTTVMISTDRAKELQARYGCKVYYLPNMSPVKALHQCYAEDYRHLQFALEEAGSVAARAQRCARVDLAKAVAHLTNFKLTRPKLQNHQVLTAHVKQVVRTEGRPWASDQKGHFGLRGLTDGKNGIVKIVSFDWVEE